MKNFLFLLCLSFSLPLLSQEHYFKASIGYGIPLGGRELTRATGDTNDYEKKIKGRLSAAKGLLFNLGVGKMYNEHFGMEVNAAGMLFGESITLEEFPVYTNEKVERYRNINITPAAKLMIPFSICERGFFCHTNLYARFGLIIPLINSGIIEYHISSGAEQVYKKEKIVNFFDPGFLAAVGMMGNIHEKLSIFFEISGQNMNNKIKSSEIVAYTVNGVDKLSEMAASEKEIIYHRKRIKENQNISPNINPDKPTDELTTITPAHNIGINIGIIWQF